jgi:hypothetical protein
MCLCLWQLSVSTAPKPVTKFFRNPPSARRTWPHVQRGMQVDSPRTFGFLRMIQRTSPIMGALRSGGFPMELATFALSPGKYANLRCALPPSWGHSLLLLLRDVSLTSPAALLVRQGQLRTTGSLSKTGAVQTLFSQPPQASCALRTRKIVRKATTTRAAMRLAFKNAKKTS